MKFQRGCGILMPVSSLASEYGIGCLSKEAYEFVDFLEKSGQGYWQVLPFGPTGFGDSPYQSFSAFAGNPYFIDPVTLKEEGLLTDGDLASFDRQRDFGSDPERVDYGKQYENREKLLLLAFRHFREQGGEETKDYQSFCKESSEWLPDYALFRAYKRKCGGKSWQEWEEPMKLRDSLAMEQEREELSEEIARTTWQQYEFWRQWNRLHAYATAHNVRIIGDLPYYVALDSADAWAHPEVFEFDEEHAPSRIAGCPPDAFSPTGQLWGNPVYDWKAQEKTGYDWWIQRIRRNLALVDVIRIDHFNGFARYYSVPSDADTAAEGKWEKGPGMSFFRALEKKLGEVPIIAEDLGEITKETETLLEESGCPGMNVLQYAFDWSESSYYLTYRQKPDSVVYTGTHDNKTTRQWIEECSDHDRDFARRFIHSENTDYGAFVWDLIREAYRSPAGLCIIPLQDYLVLGKEARINTPGTQGDNWKWRLKPHFLSEELAGAIRALSALYGRLPEQLTQHKENKSMNTEH